MDDSYEYKIFWKQSATFRFTIFASVPQHSVYLFYMKKQLKVLSWANRQVLMGLHITAQLAGKCSSALKQGY